MSTEHISLKVRSIGRCVNAYLLHPLRDEVTDCSEEVEEEETCDRGEVFL